MQSKVGRKVRILFEEHENRSGYLRIHQDLRSEGLVISKNRVYRRMRIMGLKNRKYSQK
ncbi:IS3 family transposase [Leptospira alstonii]|uniref:IS3 family transposase n=1 Tax=Leptospira alstonii TaxID=28452 RepID=UPI0013DD8CF3